MENNQDEDMYLFDNNFGQVPTPLTGQIFDDFLLSSPAGKAAGASTPAYMDPSDLTMKSDTTTKTSRAFDPRQHPAIETSGSPAGSSSSSSGASSDSPSYRENQAPFKSLKTESTGTNNNQWSSGFNGLTMPSDDNFFGDSNMSGFHVEPDYENSNQQMASDFDFETAASTPSAFPLSSTISSNINFGHDVKPPAMHSKPASQPQFFFGGSRESSPLNAMLPVQGQSPWTKHSPSSGLEETFNGITMNGDSPGNATFSPNLQFAHAGFSLETESSGTPSTFTKDISSPPSTVNSTDGSPVLTVFPTSLKSRVETQIPIRMTLHPLPPGITRLKLPKHTVSKPKFLAKPEAERSSDTLELYTSLVCTSAMQDPQKLERAYARARGEEVGPLARASPESTESQSSKDDDEKPLNGGEVKICAGCIQRERKRASRKKQKKPEEEQIFQRDEERRVVVFNTSEVKEWVEPAKEAQNGTTAGQLSAPSTLPPGVTQVELPMRIACYCRHQNEKLGFQVIFTIKDYTDKVIAQAMTNSIMITDDHKTHNPPPPIPTSSSSGLTNGPQLPGSSVFASNFESQSAAPQNAKNFKQSLSTTDLHGLQHNFNPQFPMASSSNPFAVPNAKSTTTSGTLTPRNLSRPASPSATSAPNTKRRKQSSGKVPSMLTMTRLETTHSQPTSAVTQMPSSTPSSSFPVNITGFPPPTDRGFVMPHARPGQFGTSPPTPNSNDNGFITPVNRSFSMENLPRQAQMISAPNSRQPSRPGSPASNRNSFGAADNPLSQMTNHMFSSHGRRPAPLIHKLVPAEGSITGGTEVTLLGNGFYQGLEVMFGDTEATTTTFWGEKCLNCITPPAIQPGTVAVVFKHEHPQYSQMPPQTQTRPSVFTYVDDREVEMYRLALKTLGKRLQNPTDDPYSAAQQLLGGPGPSMWAMQNNFGSGNGQQRQAGFGDIMELETDMLNFLEYFDTRRFYLAPQLDLKRPTGHTLLHLAASLGMTRFVSGLLARGANSNVLDNNGNTPMHLAAMSGHSHIVHRLRLAGADHRIRSIRNFIPADLATSLLAHQASVLPNHHYHSRSVGGTPMRLHSRNNSSNSLMSFWDAASVSNAYSDDSDDSSDDDDEIANLQAAASPVVTRRCPSGPRDPMAASFYGLSRQGSGQLDISQPQITTTGDSDQPDALLTPAAYMMAWRDQLAAQIHQYQQNASTWTLPHLPALPSLPTIPDYQTHPMVRRVSSLFPQRTISRPNTASSGREGWWESLTGSSPSSPPAYDELFPDQPTEDDYSIKKSSAIQAAGDAALDHHYELEESNTIKVLGTAQAGPSNAPRHLALQPRREIKQIKSDRKLFLIWIPLLVLVLGLMLRNALPELWRAIVTGREYFRTLVDNPPQPGILVA